MKGFIIFEDFKKNIDCKEILDGNYTCMVSDCPNGTFSGVINRVTGARCNKEDTYDFETGALIALMKMCGRDKVTKACDELYKDDNYKNTLQEMTENCEKLIKENEKLRHEYNLCLNSENALKCTVDLLNKSVDKLNKAIYGYKEDLYKVTKRCTELEAKEAILNKQEETINKREEEMSVYFGGKGNGKQYTTLVNLFKKIDQKKVDAAYKEAYQIKDFGEQINKLTVDSLIEQSRAFTRKCVDEWLYKVPTKREEMWEKIFALHKESNVIIKVKKEDINTFLHELENRIPEITWVSGQKILEAKGTIKDIYEALKTCGRISFRLRRDNKLSYSSNPDTYLYTDLEHVSYLPPMRWDLFKKGRRIIRVTPDKLDEFMKKCSNKLGCIMMPNLKRYKEFTHVFVMISDYHYDNKPTIHIMTPEDLVRNQHKNPKKYSDKKIVDWEDVK